MAFTARCAEPPPGSAQSIQHQGQGPGSPAEPGGAQSIQHQSGRGRGTHLGVLHRGPALHPRTTKHTDSHSRRHVLSRGSPGSCWTPDYSGQDWRGQRAKGEAGLKKEGREGEAGRPGSGLRRERGSCHGHRGRWPLQWPSLCPASLPLACRHTDCCLASFCPYQVFVFCHQKIDWPGRGLGKCHST